MIYPIPAARRPDVTVSFSKARARRPGCWRRHPAGWLAVALLLTSVPHLSAAVLVGTNSTWKYFKGRSEASTPDATAWRKAGFNDAGWASGRTPFFYGEPLEGGTTLNDMQNSYSTVFLRQQFTVQDLNSINDLTLNAVCDDGYVAWLNGVEIIRYGAPVQEPFLFNSLAGQNAPEPVEFISNPLPASKAQLVAGNNVLAVQVFNTAPTSSDIVFNAELTATGPDTQAPEVLSVSPPPGNVGALAQITVTFSEPVTGVDAADFLVNNTPASSVRGEGATYTFSFDTPEFGVVTARFGQLHNITDLARPANRFDDLAAAANWSYQFADATAPAIADLQPPAGLRVRQLSQIAIQFTEPVTGVDAGDLRVNGQAATSFSGTGAGPYVFNFTPVTSGSAQVNWALNHSIADLSEPPNAFSGGSWNYTIEAGGSAPNVIISEFLTGNVTGLKDETQEPQDWIEVHNRGAAPVNLEGWSLSDDANDPGQWVFPAVTLGANQFLVVFTSGLDRKPTGANPRLHTNFKLSAGGEYVGLFPPELPRRAAHEVNFPEQRNDISYGLDPAGLWRYFSKSTPGAANGESAISSAVDKPEFSVARGFFNLPFDLHLHTRTPGARIRYTFDGSPPTETNGLDYAQSLRIDRTTMLRAAAFRDGMLPSRVETHTYLFNQPANRRTIPALSIVTATNNLRGRTGIMESNPRNTTKHGIAWERPVSVELIRPEDNGGFALDAGLRVQGGAYIRGLYNPNTTSPPQGKYSWRLYFRGDYGAGKLDYPLFGDSPVQSFNRIVLRAGMNDPTNPFVYDEFIRRLGIDTGQVDSRGSFVHLFLNGVYKGYYNPTERIDSDFLQSWHGGGERWDVIAQFGELREGTVTDWNSLKSYISTRPMTNTANFQEVTRRLDVANFVDYLLVNIYGAMGDWPHNNWRSAREAAPGAKWRFYIWDAEGSFGGFGNAVTHNTFTSELNRTDTDIGLFYTRLKPSPEFKLMFADRIRKHFFNDGALTDTNILKRFRELKAAMRGPIPSMNNTVEQTWLPRRRTNIFRHFELQGVAAYTNAPVFSQHGGRVPRGFKLSMSAPAGTVIHYTTNGVDPRTPFTGAVAPEAVVFNAAQPLSIPQTLVVKARTLNGAIWSALTEAEFQFEELGSPLSLTEIMYNPQGGDAYEFIELLNTGTIPVDLRGMNFDGIDFRFSENTAPLAPGARLVLGSDRDPAAFAKRYPNVTAVGRFGGSLSNGGERLALLDRNGRTILSVTYGDSGLWPEAADGTGRSLEIINPEGGAHDPANWRASAQASGSPGEVQPASAPPVRLNEIMAENLTAVKNGEGYSDWIELHNAGASAVNLSGWSLTDDSDARKFIFPTGTTLGTGAYLVLWCDSDNMAPGLHTGFGLERSGETVVLYDPQTNRVDALTFGGQVADLSVGRVGSEAAWQLTKPTPGGANQPSETAPATDLFINEFLANAPAGSDDWIELFNQNASLPAALHGMYVGTSNALFQVRAPAFVPPRGFVKLVADENPGPDHLDFKLPASGGAIILWDSTGAEVNRLAYGAQQEGVSQGRLPDGSSSLATFTTTQSPEASNYAAAYVGPYLNEVMARNDGAITDTAGRVADWLEIYNPSAFGADLSGMSLSIDEASSGQWIFPAGSVVGPNQFLIVWCDGSRPASTKFEANLNCGVSINGESGGAFLFNSNGQLVDSIQFGFQLPNATIGRIANNWVLLERPTPNAANGSAARLGDTFKLRFNEWATNPSSGDDWFEVYNPDTAPVDMGFLYLTDDASAAGATNHLVGALTFVPTQGVAKWIADGDTAKGRHHVNFNLSARGDTLRLYSNGLNLIDGIAIGPQNPGTSEGRLPDGADKMVTFAETLTPGEANFLPIVNVVINEILSHTDPPLEDAIELHNPTAIPADISGWFLSNSADNLKKFRIPNGTVIPPGGFKVFYEFQLNPQPGLPTSFNLNSSRGDDVNLSTADAAGNLTGFRARQKFGAAENGVSLGRFASSTRVEFVPMNRRSFGADQPGSLPEFRSGAGLPNADPKVGPIVINEIMYHPVTVTGTERAENEKEEFIELFNLSSAEQPLRDPAHPENGWRLDDAVTFKFPPGAAIPGRGYAIVVSFDPKDSAEETAFRNRYKLDARIPLFGPFLGKLGNNGDTVELLKPDPPQLPPRPDAGFVPYILVERVAYKESSPWPVSADGQGDSLQRRASALFANDSLNWKGEPPTPGRANFQQSSALDSDGDGLPDDWETRYGLNPNLPADAASDADGDGLTNYEEFLLGTDPTNRSATFALNPGMITVSGGRITIRFQTAPGFSYTVQFRDSLVEGTWSKLADVPAEPAARVAEATDVLFGGAQAERYYRLVTPAVP